MRLRRRDGLGAGEWTHWPPAVSPSTSQASYAAVSMRCAPSMYFSAAFWVKLGKAASVWPSAMRSALPPEPGERFLRGRVRRCAVPDLPSSAGTVTWVGGAAIVAVHGGLDPVASSQARERIALVIGDGPQRLVLNLVDVRDRFAAECLALIAVTRHLLPPGCVLDVLSLVGLAVHRILALTGWSKPDPAARPCQVLASWRQPMPHPGAAAGSRPMRRTRSFGWNRVLPGPGSRPPEPPRPCAGSAHTPPM